MGQRPSRLKAHRPAGAAATDADGRRLAACCLRILEPAGEDAPGPEDLRDWLEMLPHDLCAGAWGALLRSLLPDEYASPPPPRQPTDTPPGSEARLAEYTRRAAAGLSLFHAADATLAEALAAAHHRGS